MDVHPEPVFGIVLPARSVRYGTATLDSCPSIRCLRQGSGDEWGPVMQLSVLIIHPVAIYHPDVFQRLMLFQDCFADSRTVILTLPPFGAHPELVRLRTALIKRGKPYFNDYFRPIVPPRRRLAAQCGWHVSDADDVARHILAAAANLSEVRPVAARSAFVSEGPSR